MPDPLLNSFLAERDEPCPMCGYNLRGLTGEHCPECAQKLVLHVGLVDPVGKSWLVGLIGLAFGGGFFDLAAALIVIVSLHEGDWPPPDRTWPLYLSAALLSLGLLWWIRSRGRVRAMSRPGQNWAATCCWVATIVCVGTMLFVAMR